MYTPISAAFSLGADLQGSEGKSPVNADRRLSTVVVPTALNRAQRVLVAPRLFFFWGEVMFYFDIISNLGDHCRNRARNSWSVVTRAAWPDLPRGPLPASLLSTHPSACVCIYRHLCPNLLKV